LPLSRASMPEQQKNLGGDQDFLFRLNSCSLTFPHEGMYITNNPQCLSYGSKL